MITAAWLVSGCGAGAHQQQSSASVVSRSPEVSALERESVANPPQDGTDDSGQDVRGAVPAVGSAAHVPAAEKPEKIIIPSIGVNSPLMDLGLQKDGTLEVPSDYQRAGWFERGAAPGRQGPAVIAGHVDSRTGPAVFYRLADLKPGAEIRVTTVGGKNMTFTVDDVQQYPKAKFPTAAVYGPVPGPVLRLITCGGQFDSTQGHYRDNVVVYAS